jgi:phosphatidylserine/phosphatidylglycerophosphate/cardiolipin synthase-like enzyme
VVLSRKASKADFDVWFSPNVPGHDQPGDIEPPDLAQLSAIIEGAQRAIFFLVFYPSKGGLRSVIAKSVEWGKSHPHLIVVGAISDSQGMWKEPAAPGTAASAPHLFQSGAVSVLRATALTDKEISRPIGDFKLGERLAAEHAIVHDKVLVVDPLDAVNCVVAFGSHNLGYKASYANDENLTIVRGHRPLAEAYAAHVLDVFDHYKFRARQAEEDAPTPGARRPAREPWDGFLHTDDAWQDKSSRHLAKYLASREPDPEG